MAIPYTFDQKEKKIRKYWLRLLLITSFGIPLLYPFVVLFKKSGMPSPIIIGIILRGIIGALIGGTIRFSILYHCAYKKFGTRWLTFALITLPFVILADMITITLPFFILANMITKALKIPFNVGFFSTAFIVNTINAIWFIYSFKLRKINKKVQLLLANPSEYRQSPDILEGAKN